MPDIVGASITLNDEPHTIIGVMPARFRFPDIADLWTLFQFDPATQDRANYFEVVGRLRPGVTRDRAGSMMAGVFASFRQAHPEMAGDNERIAVGALRDRLYGNLRTPLLVLLAAVGLVLLIACVNVANLQLAQATERRHEMALRAALGAGTLVVVRQLLIESLVLAAFSGLTGAILASVAVPALLAASPVAVAQVETIGVDLRMLGIAAAISLASGLVFGLLPALQASRPDLDRVLRAGAKRTTGGGAGWVRGALVAGEVALALMLTIGSFLLVKSLTGLQQRHPGFVAEHVLTMKLSLPEARYARGEAVAQMAERVEERVRALPGVKAASLSVSLPLQMGPDLPFTIQGKYKPGTSEGVAEALYRPIGADYFEALRIPLRRGRRFDARDRRGSLPVAPVPRDARANDQKYSCAA